MCRDEWRAVLEDTERSMRVAANVLYQEDVRAEKRHETADALRARAAILHELILDLAPVER